MSGITDTAQGDRQDLKQAADYALARPRVPECTRAKVRAAESERRAALASGLSPLEATLNPGLFVRETAIRDFFSVSGFGWEPLAFPFPVLYYIIYPE